MSTVSGELLQITREDFKWKRRTPNYFCLQIAKAEGKKFIVKKDKTTNGWVAERLE